MPEQISVVVDDAIVRVPQGASVAAAVAIAAGLRGAAGVTRRSVGGQPRAPLCGMGVCQECRVAIDGRAHSLACQTVCQPGMRVETGAAR